MTVDELKRLCREKLTRSTQVPPVPASLCLVLPGKASGNTKRFAGRRGPLGEVLSEGETDCLVAFDCVKLLKFLEGAT